MNAMLVERHGIISFAACFNSLPIVIRIKTEVRKHIMRRVVRFVLLVVVCCGAELGYGQEANSLESYIRLHYTKQE
ncbi:MAG: hypothetical protein JWN70_2012, partial [Planctomycetaceae bacterium]|nr:hypothetical protein [Planctomycetaceae bacterium]